MEVVAWKWAELLLTLWSFLCTGSQGQGWWDYVDPDGHVTRLSASDGGTLDGVSYVKLVIEAPDGSDSSTMWVHRDADRVTVLEGVSLASCSEVCRGPMPRLDPGATWSLGGRRELKVLSSGKPGAMRAGRFQVEDARPVILRCGEDVVRAWLSDSAGICRLERLEAPEKREGGIPPDPSLWRTRNRVQLHWCGKAVGKPVVSLLAREIDPGPNPALPWKGGERPLDPSVKVDDVADIAREALVRDEQDPLGHLETTRRAVRYLMAPEGADAQSAKSGIDRMEMFVNMLEKGALYSKAAEKEDSGMHSFNLGWAVLLAREAGMPHRNDGLTYLVKARKVLPDDPVVRTALSLAYDEAGLTEDAAEQMLAALDLSAASRPDHARMVAALRGGRDDAAWKKAVDDARALVETLRPEVRVRIVLRDGKTEEGTLLEYAAGRYRVREGQEVKVIPEDQVDHVVFLR